MEKILALLTEIKGFFTGTSEKLDKITAAEDRAKSLEADLATARQTIGTVQAEVEKTRTDLATAQTELTQAKADLTAAKENAVTLEAAVTEAKKIATGIIAAQGIPADQLPTQTVSSTPNVAQTAPGLAPNLKGTERLLAAFRPQTQTN